MGGAGGCYLPSYPGVNASASISGLKQQTNLRFARLYVDRASSWHCKDTASSCYGKFGFAATLRILPSDDSIHLHVFGDKSIVEVFGQAARAAITARVYPTLQSDRIGIFSNSSDGAVSHASVSAWELGSANVSVKEVLAAAGVDGTVLKTEDSEAATTVDAALPTATVLHEVDVFRSGENGVWCFRVPMVVSLPWGTLLAFAEARQCECCPSNFLLCRTNQPQNLVT